MSFFSPRNLFTFREKLSETNVSNFIVLTLLILAASAIRLYALQNTNILNPDGPLYIHQAKAISAGEWKIAVCTLPFLSNTSFFISLFHCLLQDWLLAARSVSLFFGTLAVIPLYGLFRQFFSKEDSVAAIAILIFLPTWVYNSVDGVRDPVCWCFSLYGLYWLARGVREQRRLLLSLACIAFLMAAWARIEAVWYIAAYCIFLPLLIKQCRRITSLLWFSLPILLIGAILLIMNFLMEGPSLLAMCRLDDLYQRVTMGIPQYSNLRNSISVATQQEMEPLLQTFLPEARNLVWLIGLGTLANRLCEALTYPFTLITLLGIKPFSHRNQDQNLAVYFMLMAAGALIMLYYSILQTWIMEYRYMMLAILPGLLCFCSGVSALTDIFKRHIGLPRLGILTLFVILLILITLPRLIKARGESEMAFQEIGLFLAAHHPPVNEVRVSTSTGTVRLVNFYANLDRPGLHSPEQPEHIYTSLTGTTLVELIKNLQEKEIDYLLWEEKNAPSSWAAILSDGVNEGKLQDLGHWHNHQTGRMILYQIKSEYK
ncbi:MAG: glycosyltransferase family 39 protein [Chlorobium sp.]|nr:glycosyltransferase family 39 protein [Chlorobium sp.]